MGVTHLVLASRRGSDAPGASELESRLASLGAHVQVVAADLADASAVDELVGRIAAERPLTGVVHAAGVLDDAVIASQSPERLAGVWAAKAAAAYNLHVATADLPLGLFVLFSSAASCLGSPGQGNYAAANAFCDALAAHRRASGLPGVSVAWGLWADASGMTGHMTETDLARVSRSGNVPLTSDEALELFDAACGHGGAYLLALHLNASALASADLLPPPLRAFGARRDRGGRVRRAAAAGGRQGSELLSRLAGLDANGRADAALEVVSECAAGVLGHRSPDGVRAEANFKDLGFDSLMAVELRNRLSVISGVRLPATLVFDYPTPHALAGYLCARLDGPATSVAGPSAGPTTATADDPVAIVAMACRFPGGVVSAESLWEMVAAGGDAIGAFPQDRGWDLDGLFHPDPDHPGTSYAREGGFVHDAAEFDAEFFGVNPREALAMDPQQRLLLEVSWELLERAGLDPVSLKGSRTGVYAGVMYHDYGAGIAAGDSRLEGYALMSSSGSVVSGRVAYTLGFEGPAVTVDTACSSSLVAMHLAAQALRQGECDLALAGGVTVMATPDVFTGFSRQRGLAPDGRCKPFAAAADGTGWGEGVGLVLLERLSDARRRGHEVLAVLRGSAVNQDGASNGLTAPNGPSQERVIRQALASAGLSSSDVDAVEAHGTGTTLGDPIEAGALLATYGRDRSGDRPLWLGSVKSNIGHTQAAAGVAGVIKTVMAMRNGSLPASLHIDEPSPHVDWESGAVRLLTEPMEWPTEDDRPRRAGVSSFGASGTNAHLILEQAPEPKNEPEDESEPVPFDGVLPWVLSAHNADALRGQAAALAAHVSATDDTSVEVGWSLLKSRSLLDQRAVVLGEDRAQLLAGVEALAAGEPHPALVRTGPAATASGKSVFLFSGQGSQRVGMGAGLYERFPVFAGAFDEVCGLLDEHLERPLKDVVFTGLPDQPELLDHTTYAQTGLFALQVGLARLLASLGVVPDVVVGHSVGEIAAAHVAGVFGLEDACRLVAARATLMGGLPSGGAMAAIQATADELTDDLARFAGRVAIAALNTPDSTVVSGPADLVSEVAAAWKERGRKTKALAVSHAFHSPMMDPILDEFTDAISDLTYRRPNVPLISNLSGLPADDQITTPEYWATHIRRPVRFAPAIAHLAPQAGVFLELGPDPVLATAAQHTLHHAMDEHEDGGTDEAGRPVPPTLSTLNGKQDDPHAFAHAMARLHTSGAGVDWTDWFPAKPAPRVVALPTYAFQRERYWLAPGRGAGDVAAVGLRRVEHAVLPAAVPLADGGLLLTGRMSASGGWASDHRMLGTTLVPGAALAEWALRAADETGCGAVEELVLQAPLVLPPTGAAQIQVVADAPGSDGRRELRVYSRPEHDDGSVTEAPWVCHAMGVLTPEARDVPEGLDGAWPPPGAEPVDVTAFYERMAATGYEYGPSFRGLRAAWRDGPDILAEVQLPEAAGDRAGFGVHPALLDAVLHAGLLPDGEGEGEQDGRVWLPFAWNGISLWASEAATVRVRLAPVHDGDGEGRDERGVRVTVADSAGAAVLTVDSVVTRPADIDKLKAAGEPDADGLFALEWTPLPAPALSDPTLGDDDWAVLGTDAFGPADCARFPDLAALSAALDADRPSPTLVLADASYGESDDLDAVGNVLSLLQAWLDEPRLADARLVVVTRGAVASDVPDLAGAGVWGLVRSAQAENPGRFVLLDLEADTFLSTGLADAVARAAEAREPQLAVRSGELLIPRLVRASERQGIAAPTGERAWRLAVATPGTVENVAPEPFPKALEPLAAGQVRIEVRAGGINFRDVLVTLGMVPGQTGLGGEGAGVVTEVGPGVFSGLSVGDRVMGLFEGAFGPVTVADERMVSPIPEDWDFRSAAAVPIVFLTAWYGLVELAGLKSGESVLVHAATGGVGSAAVQIARHLGAEVFATASPGKHAVLEAMGIDAAHRASSRDLEFERTFRDATGGRGVDVVLNSLAGSSPMRR
ncbi:beta-ketoacyl synthase N-terminal-like domain-containing protein [Actinomadura yumaensis]|uniref:beta-ketoacyl synthase N-terminal-like domain-containing protein n=1 Tax=Actinomadura yumaensis TaxID=111807 RepID=UPI003A925DC0